MGAPAAFTCVRACGWVGVCVCVCVCYDVMLCMKWGYNGGECTGGTLPKRASNRGEQQGREKKKSCQLYFMT